MRNFKAIIFISFLGTVSAMPAYSNDIYITQSGAGLNLDIIQDGQNNVAGTSTTAVSLTGASMAYSLTQTGNTNILTSDLEGASASIDMDIIGDSNDVVLKCDATGNYSCDNWNVDLDINDSGAATGDSSNIDIDVGTTMNSDDSDVTLQILGDSTTANIDIDGASSPVSVTSTGSTNNFQIDVDGNGDSAGHAVTIVHTGSGATYDVVQSGAYDSILNLTVNTAAGAAADVDISQTQ